MEDSVRLNFENAVKQNMFMFVFDVLVLLARCHHIFLALFFMSVND